jgi:hypothetical protein
MQKQEEPSIDEILENIRSAIVEKERKRYFQQFWPEKSPEKPREEVFELSSSMLVKKEDIPYELGLWTFDDVAHNMIKKYRLFFEKHLANESSDDVRVSVKEDK